MTVIRENVSHLTNQLISKSIGDSLADTSWANEHICFWMSHWRQLPSALPALQQQATARKLQSLTNYVLSNIHLDSVIYPSILQLMHLMVLLHIIFTYQALIHFILRDIIIHHVTAKYQNKVDMKGLIVLKLMGCHNNSTIIFALPNGTSSLSMGCTFRRYGHMKLPMRTYQNHTTCSISQACSFKSFVDVSVLQHALINANLCCLSWYKFHIHKL